MPNKGVRKYFYLLSSLIIVLAFIIKPILDSIYKNVAQEFSNEFSLLILLCSIFIVFFSFLVFVYIQYKVRHRQTILACTYDPSIMCCLMNFESGGKLFGDDKEILNDVELAKHEREVTTNEIWLLSPDLSCEASENVFTEVVRARLNEGVDYFFIALDSELSRERVRKIRNQYLNCFTKKRMHFYLIQDEVYTLFLSMYSIAIYDPVNKYGKNSVFICVGETKGSDTSIYLKVKESHAQAATNITRSIIEKTSEYIPH